MCVYSPYIPSCDLQILRDLLLRVKGGYVGELGSLRGGGVSHQWTMATKGCTIVTCI